MFLENIMYLTFICWNFYETYYVFIFVIAKFSADIGICNND